MEGKLPLQTLNFKEKSEQMNQFYKGQTITRLIFKATIYF